MKILTATYHHEHNYGAMLQAYALQQCLISLGYENEIIDYVENIPTIFKKVGFSPKKQNLSALLYNAKVLLKYKKFKTGYQRFEDFYNKNMIKTKRYELYEELKDIDGDMLLAGSDQLWNFKNRDSINKFFTFSFNHSIKKVTYAISMGGFHGFSKQMKQEFNNCVKEFDYISVREPDVIEYLEQENVDVEYQINIDPVFLLQKEQWFQLVDSCQNEYDFGDYIVCYELIPNPVLNIILHELKEKFGYKVVIVAPNAYSKLKGDYIINDAGPVELLKIIKNAKYVVSTSFHGIAFSIIFNKPFYAVLSSHAPGRIKTLLKTFGFENKGIGSADHTLDYNFDYSQVDNMINKQREDSIQYLSTLKK